MMIAKLQQTEFSVEKIRNVVNVGSSSAYQICTTPGKTLGFICGFDLPGTGVSSNDSVFTAKTRTMPAGGARIYRLK